MHACTDTEPELPRQSQCALNLVGKKPVAKLKEKDVCLGC